MVICVRSSNSEPRAWNKTEAIPCANIVLCLRRCYLGSKPPNASSGCSVHKPLALGTSPCTDICTPPGPSHDARPLNPRTCLRFWSPQYDHIEQGSLGAVTNVTQKKRSQ